jgi:hypothetical protein
MEESSNVVEIIDPKTKQVVSFYMSPRLKKLADEKIKPVINAVKDEDYLIALDGAERSGKSTLALQLAKYVDPTMNLDRVVFTPEEFRDAIFKAGKGQAIVYDEAFNGLSSRASLSGVNKVLVSLMMQMGQKNLFVIIVLPTFFLLDKYVAIWRAKRLIHVYKSKKTGKRGFFRVYNSKKKKMLYLYGKQTYSYDVKEAYTKFKGRFYGTFALGGKNLEDKYRKKKAKALEDTEQNPMTAAQVKYREQRDLVIYLYKKNNNITLKEFSSLLSDYGVDLSYNHISEICRKRGLNVEKEDKNKESSLQIEEQMEEDIKDELLDGTDYDSKED